MDKVTWAITVVLVPLAFGVPAFAQPEAAAPTVPGATTNTPQQRSPANTATASPPAVTMSNADTKAAAAPVKGARSFTRDEAQRRIEAGGSSQVTGPRDDDGVWRGQAMRGGISVSVFCDYQGNAGAS